MAHARWRRPRPALRKLWPYVAVELFLPGGTLVALLMWIMQRSRQGAYTPVHRPAVPPYSIERRVRVSRPCLECLGVAA